jgi:DNA-directed RNA polymerase subunit RPC12/RpoP
MIMYCPLCTRELTQIDEVDYICPECNSRWLIEQLD